MADVPSVCEGWELIKASPHLRGSVFSSTAAALLREEVSAVVRFHPCVDDWLVCCDYHCCAGTLCGKVAAGDSVTVAATGLPAVDHQIFNKQLPKLLPVWLSYTHRASKPELCLLLSVDSLFLSVDRYNPDLNFCTFSCLNPC
ncbi:hypothetical protein Taro_025573 [Colocasia esculenta]|uniref:Uncharacterized protein n=1 Tax=Colocasia esculenta TaxID=4460 RepID=A0A843VCL3_COLES|nr:hypothetical protein [Colocasia esculenta]